MAITFSVSEVAKEALPLPRALVSDVLRRQRLVKVEAASQPPRPYVECPAAHGLLQAVHLAYQWHYPLILSPDHIWLCIAQGLARHINENAEALRGRFVRHQGKIPLEVRRDQFIKGAPDNDWPGVFSEFSTILREHMGGRRDLFLADFSTTDPISRTVSEVVLLGAVQKYFHYTVMSMCGIPEITLEGAPEDWAKIRQRVEVLEEFDLSWWVKELRPVVAQFEAASKGEVDRGFWQELYKRLNASGGERVSGYLNALFPYCKDEGKKQNPWFKIPDKQKASSFSFPKFDDFPCGLTSAPFAWKFLTEEYPMSFVGGFFGVVQEENRALRPQLGWAITEEMKGPVQVTDPWRLEDQAPEETVLQRAGGALRRLFTAKESEHEKLEMEINALTKEVQSRKEEHAHARTDVIRQERESSAEEKKQGAPLSRQKLAGLKERERAILTLLREAQDRLFEQREKQEKLRKGER